MNKDILQIIENDARTTPKQLSAMTGTPTTEITKQIKQAEKERVILKYKTVINWDKVHNEQVWALIEVKLTPQKDVGFDSVAEHIYRFPQTRSVYLVSGSYDLFESSVNHRLPAYGTIKAASWSGFRASKSRSNKTLGPGGHP